jgi:hypothetical protein
MIAEALTDAIAVIVKEIEETEVGIEIIHDILIEIEGTTTVGIIVVVTVKVRTMIEMQIGTAKQTVTAADVMKTWIDHEDPAPDPDPQKDTTEVTDIFAFVLEVNDTAMAAL